VPDEMLDDDMPSVMRFLIMSGVVILLAYGAMWVVTGLVVPEHREVTSVIPAQKLNK
jgi:hypothetical protein